MDFIVSSPQGQFKTPNSSDSTNQLAGAVPAISQQLRVLLVDDSPDNRFVIAAYLKKVCQSVDHAQDGSIAVEMFGSKPYDLVLMDIQMPIMDGYTAVRTIRELERTRGLLRTPIIALTASELNESERCSLEAGCDAHLSKPIGRATLLEVIIKVTASHNNDTETDVRSVDGGSGHTKRQLIYIDEYLRDLIPNFLAHKLADVTAIGAAIDLADCRTISSIGHKLKGEGGSYGFDAVTTMGATFELAGMAKDLTSARDTLAQFAAYLESIEVVYG